MSAPRRNRGHVYRSRIDAGRAGARLLDHLVATHPHSSADEWRERIAEGLVLVDDRIADEGSVLRAGAEVAWHRPPWVEPAAPRSFEVLLDEEGVLAVAKPAGLPTLPGAGFFENTLLSAVREIAPEAAPAHRLGRWTSGIVVFGRTTAICARLASAWGEPGAVKRYRLRAVGDPPRDELLVDVPIGPVPYATLGSVHAASPDGRPARTRVTVLEREGGSFLADAFLETGRPHQIRIHLAAAGHPLVGDPLYRAGGLPDPTGSARPGDPGYRLHAAELRLPIRIGGKSLALRCPSPAALRRAPDQPTR